MPCVCCVGSLQDSVEFRVDRQVQDTKEENAELHDQVESLKARAERLARGRKQNKQTRDRQNGIIKRLTQDVLKLKDRVKGSKDSAEQGKTKLGALNDKLVDLAIRRLLRRRVDYAKGK